MRDIDLRPHEVSEAIGIGKRYKTSAVAKILGISSYNLPNLIRKGEIRATKHGQHWWIEAEEVERLLQQRSGIANAQEAAARIAELEAEIELLNRRLDERHRLFEEELSETARKKVDAAEEALRLVEPERALELLAEYALVQNSRQWQKETELQRLVDRAELPATVGKRPKNVHVDARMTRLATGIGRIDVWYWQTQTGLWWAVYGGPRPSRRISHRQRRELQKVVKSMARSQYGRPMRFMSQRLRFTILKRDGFACHYCGRKPPEVELHVDHVIPVADGGSSDPENLVAACSDCNAGKSDR